MNLKMWHLYWGILVLTVAAGDVVYAYYESHQRIEIPLENRQTFVQAVVAVDPTRSEHSEVVATAKHIVAKRIIPSIGPGDRLLCLTIGPGYGLSSNIFGETYEDQVPQGSQEWRTKAIETVARLRQNPQDTMAGEQVRDLARDLIPLWPSVERVHLSWSERLQSLQRPKRDGTWIVALLQGVQAEFSTPPRPHEERWVFIVSDLLEEPPAGVRGASTGGYTGALNETHVVLVYPHDSDRDWERIIQYWKSSPYFQGSDITVLPFSEALDDPFLLAPNPVAGLQRVEVRSAWEFLRVLLLPEGFLICGAAIVGFLVDALANRWSRRPAVSWNAR